MCNILVLAEGFTALYDSSHHIPLPLPLKRPRAQHTHAQDENRQSSHMNPCRSRAAIDSDSGNCGGGGSGGGSGSDVHGGLSVNPTHGCVVLFESLSGDASDVDLLDAYTTSLLALNTFHSCDPDTGMRRGGQCQSSSRPMHVQMQMRAWTYREATLETATDWQGENTHTLLRQQICTICCLTKQRES
jgi:hypothetical protein